MPDMNVVRPELRVPVQETSRPTSVLNTRLRHDAVQPGMVVLALPHDVAPAVEIAKLLGVPSDVFLVRKPGAPKQRESSVTALLRELEVSRPDLLVLGAYKQSEVGMVFGPQSPGNPTPQLGVRNVLYATDQSSASVHALHCAYDMAREHNAKLIVLQVEAKPEGVLYDDAVIVAFEALQNWLDGHLLAHGGEAFGRAQCLVKFGKPEQGIPEAANELHSDVVVMGARGLSALSAGRNNFIGSIAYEVACSSERPVLIVPQTAKSISNGRQHR
ncbi:MAG: hypothetical protein DMG67_12775 [Acidobacteria bacterium]|nr:MAG: hypothetical protein DMG67_12775 [Acidobacteriota bacterium]